jgi:hypothetical protein
LYDQGRPFRDAVSVIGQQCPVAADGTARVSTEKPAVRSKAPTCTAPKVRLERR